MNSSILKKLKLMIAKHQNKNKTNKIYLKYNKYGVHLMLEGLYVKHVMVFLY